MFAFQMFTKVSSFIKGFVAVVNIAQPASWILRVLSKISRLCRVTGLLGSGWRDLKVDVMVLGQVSVDPVASVQATTELVKVNEVAGCVSNKKPSFRVDSSQQSNA